MQNHRTILVGRDFWRSSSPTSGLKQVLNDGVAELFVHVSLEYLWGWKFHLSVHVSVFPIRISCVLICVYCLFAYHKVLLRRVWLSSLYPVRQLKTATKSALIFLFLQQNKASSLSLSSSWWPSTALSPAWWRITYPGRIAGGCWHDFYI